MASSQVEIASSSPFGCVLKDHNSRRERRRDPNPSPNPKSQSNFQRNLKELVRDHLHSCISITPKGSNTEPDENYHHNNGNSVSCFGNGGTGSGGGGSNSCRSNNNHNNNHNHQHNLHSSGNRWAAQKAKEMMTTIESLSSKPQSTSLISKRDPSPTPSNSSSNDFSVSSLVRKWRGYEAEAKHIQPNNNNNNANVNVNVNPEMSRPNSAGSTCESTITTTTTMEVIEDRDGGDKDVTYDREAMSSCSTDGGERERIRVADIVRKWACDEAVGNNQEQQQPPFGACLARLRIGMEPTGGGEQRMFSPPVVCSPRLRGRQAIADLYMRMERERYKEVESLASRQAVSKFPQRGRIQSLLRLRFLRHEVFMHDHRQPFPQSRAVRSNRPQTPSVITSLRERFSTISDQDSINSRRPHRDTPNSNQVIESPHMDTPYSNHETKSNCTSNQPFEHAICQEDFNIQSCHIKSMSNIEDAATTSTFDQESKKQTHALQKECIIEDSVQENSFTHAMEVLEEENPSSDDIWQETSYHDVENLDTQGEVDAETPYHDWEEEEDDIMYEDQEVSSQQLFESNLDWISDIARPRSYWEDRRQARYQEVFNTKSQDEEIRQLLERGSVSAVLASDFRDRMDRLMMCSVQRAMDSTNHNEEDDHSLSDFLQLHITPCNHQLGGEQHDQEHVNENTEDVQQEEENEEENEDEREEDEEVTSSIHQYHDGGDYYDQTPSSSQMPWDHHYQDHEASFDSDHAASTTLQQSSFAPSYDHDTQEGSSFKNSTIEMELIYDLRAHMEQIYREMSELRKSISSCVDMQMKLQHSIREEVSAAINHSDRVEGNDSNGRQPKKGSCCICYEKKVDSLLYRCGHMCTCFKCAHELQWSSGKCPICRAQIVDVVRAYPDT